jgi:putative oxidoreductase
MAHVAAAALHRAPERVTSRAIILIRVMVGAVFLSEGIQKFMYPEFVGAGRFARIGIPAPELVAPLVGVVEVTCGALLLLGLFTRFAVLPLMGVMVVALITTKLPVLLGQDLGPFQLRQLNYYGFWSMAHEARTDLSMLLGAAFLFVTGGGAWSLDQRLVRARLSEHAVQQPADEALQA